MTGPGPTPVIWRRSARARRISLRLDLRTGAVVLTLPLRATRAAGQAMLDQSAEWIATRVGRLPAPVVLADGAIIPVHGTAHRVTHHPGGRGIRLGDGALYVPGDPAFLPRRVTDFLRAEAGRHLGALARAQAAQLGRPVARIVIKDTRTRWGSCTARGVLMFSWRLVMAPPWVQAYVVAHEAAHLRHMNHGPAFWALLDTLTPHRVAAEAWLLVEGPGLLRVDC